MKKLVDAINNSVILFFPTFDVSKLTERQSTKASLSNSLHSFLAAIRQEIGRISTS